MNKCVELYKYLIGQVSTVFSFKLVDLTKQSKMIVVTSNDDEFYIEVSNNDDIFLYSDGQNYDLMKKIIPVINVYKNGESPSFEYNTYDVEQDMIIDNTFEWSSNKEERFAEINSNITSRYPYVIKNLKVLFESKEEKEKRFGFTDFATCYFPNGSLDNFDEFISMVDKYNEQDCFLVLQSLKTLLSYGSNKNWKGYFPDSVVVDDSVDVVLNKVSMLLDNNSNSLNSFVSSEQYIEWYNKWNDYFTYEKKCEYMESRLNNEDVSSFVPKNVQFLKKMQV